MKIVNVEGITAKATRETVFCGMDVFDRAVSGHGVGGDAASLLKQSVRDQVGDTPKVTAQDLKQVISNLGDEHRKSGGLVVDKAFSAATQIYINRTNDVDVFQALPKPERLNVPSLIERGHGL
jgi:hypothetical protein